MWPELLLLGTLRNEPYSEYIGLFGKRGGPWGMGFAASHDEQVAHEPGLERQSLMSEGSSAYWNSEGPTFSSIPSIFDKLMHGRENGTNIAPLYRPLPGPKLDQTADGTNARNLAVVRCDHGKGGPAPGQMQIKENLQTVIFKRKRVRNEEFMKN